MKKCIYLIFVCIANFIILAQYSATDISYKCLGGKQYLVKLEVYTECSIDGGLVADNRFPLYLKSQKLNLDVPDIYFDRATIKNEAVRLFCNSVNDNCTDLRSDKRGLRKSVFYKTLDMSKYESSDDWEVSFLFDAKADLYKNHLAWPKKYPDKTNHTASTIINTKDTICNNSPIFNELPILKSCLNQRDTIALGIIDPDGDQLKFTLANPINKVDKEFVEMIYLNGYSNLKPLDIESNLILTNDGKLILKGTKDKDVGNVDLIIDEYRKGVKVASTRRNIQINVFDCNNNAPVVTDFVNPQVPSSPKQVFICSGDHFTKQNTLIKVSDSDNNIKSIVVSPRSDKFLDLFNVDIINTKTAEIYINNKEAYPTNKDDTVWVDVKVTDDGCPSERTTSKTFMFVIKAKPIFDFGYDEAFMDCHPFSVLKPKKMVDFNSKDQIVPIDLSGIAPFKFLWKTWDINVIDGTSDLISNDVYLGRNVDSLIVSEPMAVTVEITDKNGCSSKDSIYLKNGLEFDFAVHNRCYNRNDSTVFVDQSWTTDPNDSIVSRVWDFGDGSGLTTSKRTVSKKYCSQGLYPLKLTVTNSKGCSQKFEDMLRIHRAPEANFSVEINCQNRLFINDSSYYFPVFGPEDGFKSYKYANADYFVTKVYSGIDSLMDVRVSSRALLDFICDTLKIEVNTDSIAADWVKKSSIPTYYYSANIKDIKTKVVNKYLSFVATSDSLKVNFHQYELDTIKLGNGLETYDTLQTGLVIPFSFAIKDLLVNKVSDLKLDSLIHDRLTGVMKNVKIFAKEDDLVSEVKISTHPSIEKNDYIFPHLNFNWEKQNDRLQIDTGVYLIKQVVYSSAECTAEITKEVRILPEPKIKLTDATGLIELSDTIVQNCNKIDTTIFVQILNGQNGNILGNWQLNPIEENIDNRPFLVDLNKSISQLGTYYLYVKDQKGCDDTTSIHLVNYLNSQFVVAKSCDTDTVSFLNQSTSGKGPKIVKNQWYVLDYTTRDTIQKFEENRSVFKKPVPDSVDVLVLLRVKDSLSCIRDQEQVLYNTKFDDIFELPDSRTASVCVSDKIYPKSIEITSKTFHIDSIVWNLGDGRKLVQKVQNLDDLNKFYFTYPDDKTYQVSYKVYFNGVTTTVKDPVTGATRDSVIQQSCLYSSNELSVGIKPEFKGKLFSFRNCTSDTSEFIFEKDLSIGDSTVKVKNIKWNVESRTNVPEPDFDFPLTKEDAYSFKQLFKKAREIRISFTAYDDNGCVFSDNTDARIDELGRPIIPYMDSVCFGTPSTIKLRSDNLTLEGNIRPANKYGIEYLGSQIKLDRYETSTGTETIKHVFPAAGTLPIKAFMIQYFTDVKSMNSDKVQECRGVLDTTIYVKPYPEILFSSPTVCARQDTTWFTNLTKFNKTTKDPKDSLIVGYVWDFGDSTERSNIKNPGHVYKKGGQKSVTLTAFTANGCSTSKTLKTNVFGTPDAYFQTTVDSSLLDFNQPIEFVNLTTPKDSNSYVWDFGDGSQSNLEDPLSHAFGKFDRFEVILSATNKQGCKDTYIKEMELRPILLLPNVFSPNSDGINDDIFLIYRLIDVLEEFKIYNRWGELVFDAHHDLKARWDGKFKGTDQEAGVYVAYVKARGKYGYNYNFKENITLLR